MAYRGLTKRPYECCGAPAPQFGRPLTGVCAACEALQKDGQTYRDTVQQVIADRQTYVWVEPGREYAWPCPREFFYGDKQDALRRALGVLIATVALPVPAVEEKWWDKPGLLPRAQGEYYEWKMPVEVSPPTAEALAALVTAMATALGAAYADGLKRGRSSLLALAAGEMSLADFEKGPR
jgi:hypothetical protein